MIMNYILITKTSHKNFLITVHKQNIYPHDSDNTLILNIKTKNTNGFFLTETIFFISIIKSTPLLPKKSPLPISRGNTYVGRQLTLSLPWFFTFQFFSIYKHRTINETADTSRPHLLENFISWRKLMDANGNKNDCKPSLHTCIY